MSENLLGKRVASNVFGKVVSVSESSDSNRRYMLEMEDLTGAKFYVPVDDEDIVSIEFEEESPKKEKEPEVNDFVKEGDVWYDMMDQQTIVIDALDIEYADYNPHSNVIDLVECMLDLDEDILLMRNGEVQYEGLKDLANVFGIETRKGPGVARFAAYDPCERVLMVPNTADEEQAMYLLLGAIRLV